MTDLKEIEAHDGSSLSDRGPDQETVPQSSEITYTSLSSPSERY